MGYYTRFTIEVKGDVKDIKEIAEEVNETSQYFFHAYSNNYGNTLEADDEYKWYDWNEDMKQISENHPELLFIIEGVGEEDDDHWRCYMTNGKEERKAPVITWPESELEKEWEASKVIHEILTED